MIMEHRQPSIGRWGSIWGSTAHRVGSAVEQAYRRSDQFEKRRQLAQAWARYITQPPAEGAVVPLHADRTAG